MKKESFILYHSFWEPVKDLPREDKGELLEAIFSYQVNDQVMQLSPAVKMAFAFIRNQFERDNKAYLEKCQKMQECGKLGGRPKNQKVISETKRLFQKPKKADTDTDTDTDTDNHKYIPQVCYEIVDLIIEHSKKQSRVYKCNLDKSADTIRLMHSVDKLNLEEVKSSLIRYIQLYTGAQYDPQVFSAEALRDKWNKLLDFISRQDKATETTKTEERKCAL